MCLDGLSRECCQGKIDLRHSQSGESDHRTVRGPQRGGRVRNCRPGIVRARAVRQEQSPARAGGGPRVPRTADAIADSCRRLPARSSVNCALGSTGSVHRRSGFSVFSPPRAASRIGTGRERHVPVRTCQARSDVRHSRVEARTNRRRRWFFPGNWIWKWLGTTLLDVLDGVAPGAGGVRHVVLDLRGLTFMDARGLRESFR